MIKRLILLVFIGITHFSWCQDRIQLMHQFFDSIEKYDQGMGSIAIFQDGKEQFKRVYGMANLVEKTKATQKTKYRIGSISKIFTAICIMQLVDEGKIKLDQKLAVFFPDLPNADKITLEHLLRHRSGLHNFLDDEDYEGYMTTAQTRQDHLNRFKAKGTDFEPDEKYSYSNTNYVLLAFICEEVDKMPFPELLRKRILKPLKLKNTYHAPDYDLEKREALSYYWAGQWNDGWQTHGSISMGAGSLVSTVSDLNRFLFALENGKLVSKASLAQMKTMVDGYGLGLFQLPYNDDLGYGHTGGIDGFQSVLAYFPDHNTYVAFCGNGIKYTRNEIVLNCLKLYFNDSKTIPDVQEKPGIKLSNIEPYLGTYSCVELGMQIEITGANGELAAQAIGQSQFPLKASDENTFAFDPAGIVIRFDLTNRSFILEQGGGRFIFIKE